jgi:hypothetical protein
VAEQGKLKGEYIVVIGGAESAIRETEERHS